MAKRTLIFFIVIAIALFCGCRSVNEEKRISGIVDAVYTSYKTEKNIEKVENYLTKKVSNSDITKEVKYTIIECLKKGEVK